MRSLSKNEPFSSHETLKQLSLTVNSNSKARRQSEIEDSLLKYIRYIKENEFFKKSTKKSTLASSILIATSIIENELYFHYEEPVSSTILRLMICLLSIYMVWLVVEYYKHLFNFRIISKQMYKTTQIWEDPFFKYLLLEVLINGIFLPPYVNASFKFYQLNSYNTLSLDDMFVMVYMARSYHIVKFIHHHSTYNTQVGHFFCKLVHKSYSVQFSIKAFIKDHALAAVCLGGFSISLMSGILLRIFERTTPDSSFHDYWAAFWVICATQTTLGYGEFKPFSHMGRMVCIVTCLLSIFLCSYLVMIFRSKSNLLSYEQELLSQVIYKQALDSKSKKKGVVFIQRWWRLMAKRQRKLPRFKEFSEFCQSFFHFKLSRNNFIAFKDLGLEHEINSSQTCIQEQFDKVNRSLSLLDRIKNDVDGINQLALRIMTVSFKLHIKKQSYLGLLSPKNQSARGIQHRIKMKKSMDIARKKVIQNIHC